MTHLTLEEISEFADNPLADGRELNVENRASRHLAGYEAFWVVFRFYQYH